MADQSKPAGVPESDADGNAPAEGEAVAGRVEPPDIVSLVQTHHQAVYRYAFRLTGGAADAEDLTQQTFLIAHQKLDQIRDPGKADRWLFAVLRSCFLKNRRRRTPALAGNLDLDLEAVPDASVPGDEVDQEQLQRVLSELPDRDRLVLVMFYFEDYSYKQIACELEIPIGTVMSRLARAKNRLRRGLLARHTSPNRG